MRHLSRRLFLTTSAALAAPFARPSAMQDRAAPPPPDPFPRQAPEMVQEMVLVSHVNAKRVRELVEKHPALARAAVDWGFGDWEDALGAASHIGNREIAQYLIANGARPTIFSAAMLGQLDVVKSYVTATPGVQRIAGPHSISLLAHAKAGGTAAAAVFDYLNGLGDAGGPKTEPISSAELASLTGAYLFGPGAADRIDISLDKGQLTIMRPGLAFARPLYYLGEWAFFPAGAAAVRIRFAMSNGASTLTVHDPDIVLTAVRRP